VDLKAAADLTPLAAPFDVSVGLRCERCAREFPTVDGVQVLWTDQLKALQLAAPSESADLAERVMRANIEIYDDVADDHGEHTDHLFNYHDTLLFLKAFAVEHQLPAGAGRPRVVVDVGCGAGVGLDAGANFYEIKVGVDISLSNLRHVARKGYVAVLGDSSRLPFAPGTVDLVTCFAALHHFPSPESFAKTSFESLRAGGVLLTGCDPSRALMSFSPLAQMVWDTRKPVYRALSRFSKRFYLHSDSEVQERNDLAEYQRTEGGFTPEELGGALRDAGFDDVNVFYGLDPGGHKKVAVPSWKIFLLKALSLQNPVRPSNWMSLSSVARKGTSAGGSIEA
jgi:SAM-dependent methyltransferase